MVVDVADTDALAGAVRVLRTNAALAASIGEQGLRRARADFELAGIQARMCEVLAMAAGGS